MSGVYEEGQRLQEQRDLADHIHRLIEAEVLPDGAAQGIARQVMDRGAESLSDKQREVFRRQVEEPFCKPECERCGTRIPVSEAWDLEEGDVASVCSGCKRDYERMMKE